MLNRSFFLAFITLSLVVGAFADTIRLKDGGIIKGRIVSFSDGQFVIEIGQGSRVRLLTFEADEVASIEFDSPQGYTPSPRTNPQGSMVRTGGGVRQPGETPILRTNTQTNDNGRITTTDTETSVTARVIRPTGSAPRRPNTSSSVPTRQPDSGYSAPARQTDPAYSPTREPDKNSASPARQPAVRVSELTKPVELAVKVVADNTSNGWTNSGWVVRQGQRIRITADGQVSLGRGQTATPSGSSELNDEQKLLKGVPTGALIAVIGDDNNDFMYIGAEREFTATRDGALFLGVNEGNLNDNSGAFNVKVLISPSQDR